MNAWPYFAPDEITAAQEVLASGKVNYWTGGLGKAFEQAFARYLGLDYGIVLANGTLALEAALYAIDIQPGDEVIVPCRTFLATASAVVAQGGIPVLADVELESQNISLATILPQVTAKTKAIIVVHLAGYPCDMGPILAFAKEKGIKVIEDCAQAHGALYKGEKVGALGDIAAYSFCQDKIMTTGGEGGFVGTQDPNVWKKIWQYKDHGKDPDLCDQSGTGKFRWLHTLFGSNWRLTEMQSAIGLKQLEKLETWVQIRQKNARILTETLNAFPQIQLPLVADPSSRHSYYRYYIRLTADLADRRDPLLEKLTVAGVVAMTGSCFNIGYEKAFQRFPSQFEKKLPNAEILGKTALTFLVHPTITEDEMRKTAEKIDTVLRTL